LSRDVWHIQLLCVICCSFSAHLLLGTCSVWLEGNPLRAESLTPLLSVLSESPALADLGLDLDQVHSRLPSCFCCHLDCIVYHFGTLSLVNERPVPSSVLAFCCRYLV
jgi:hypothetical protein